VGSRISEEEKLEPVTNFTAKDLEGKEIIEKDGQKFVRTIVKKTVYGYKTFKDGILL